MNRIAYKESIENMLLTYPCLKQVLEFEHEQVVSQLVFSSDKINKVMGFDFVQKNDLLTSKMMNKVLDKMLEAH